ncbi:MAG: PIN domain-containing protein [Hymenobacter sp.]|nr:MAG: PIN domain-containing protein [Hymenobacter sp.]
MGSRAHSGKVRNRKCFYLDSNVVLDFLLDWLPYAEAATKLLAAAEQGKVTLLISSLTYTIAHYVVSKAIGKNAALQALISLHSQVGTAAVDDTIIEQALQAGWPDFEDAVQLFAALEAGAEAVITRDPKGLPTQLIAVLDPLSALEVIASQ